MAATITERRVSQQPAQNGLEVTEMRGYFKCEGPYDVYGGAGRIEYPWVRIINDLHKDQDAMSAPKYDVLKLEPSQVPHKIAIVDDQRRRIGIAISIRLKEDPTKQTVLTVHQKDKQGKEWVASVAEGSDPRFSRHLFRKAKCCEMMQDMGTRVFRRTFSLPTADPKLPSRVFSQVLSGNHEHVEVFNPKASS